jgi:hypothetical protein
MPSLRITAVAALATAALVVPATASAQNGTQIGTIGTPTELKVNLPAESEWSHCATEGGRCEFTGTRQVRYGGNGKFTLPRTFTGGVACNNATFGIDPAPNVVKQCQVTGGSQMKDEAATAAAISQPAASCGPTAAKQAELTDMAAQLSKQLALSQGGVSNAAQMMAKVQDEAAKVQETLAASAQVNEADKAAAEKLVAEMAAMMGVASKAAQQAAQSQGNLSTADQALAALKSAMNSMISRP